VFYQTDILSLKIRPRTTSGVYFIVSKNITKNSVQRNKIKRKLRHAFKEAGGREPKNKTFFFYAKKNIILKKYQEIKKDIGFLIKRSKI